MANADASKKLFGPCEKAKNGRVGSTCASSSARLGKNLFFDTIPLQVFDNFLRFLSGLPLATNWTKRIPLTYILELYRVHGDLGKFRSSRFRTLCISKTVHCDYEHREYEWKVPNTSMLWTDSMDIAHQFVSGGGGEYLDTIIVGEEMYNEERNGGDMVYDFLRACPNVRSLSVVENDGRWIFAFATQLEKLEVVIKSPKFSIPKIFPYLLELNLYFKGTYPDESPYSADETAVSYLERPGVDWEFSGTKLLKLILRGIFLSGVDLEIMREHCRNLKHIEMRSVQSFLCLMMISLISFTFPR